MSNWFEDMSIMWFFVVMDDYVSIFVEMDVRIVSMVNIIFCMYNNSFNNVIFFNNVFWCCLFYCINDNIINVCCFVI